jgi:hypothetical protein
MPVEYHVAYLSGALEFPDTVEQDEALAWAGKALSQQLNAYAAQGWEVMDVRWVSDLEMMVIFTRPRPPVDAGAEA